MGLLTDNSGVVRFEGTITGTGAGAVLTAPVALTAAEILAWPQRVQLVAGTPGVLDFPLALVVQTGTGAGGYDMTGVNPFLSSGSGEVTMPALQLTLGAGGTTALISQDVQQSTIEAPAGDLLEGGIALSSEGAPAASGGTPDWGFAGTLYYLSFTP